MGNAAFISSTIVIKVWVYIRTWQERARGAGLQSGLST